MLLLINIEKVAHRIIYLSLNAGIYLGVIFKNRKELEKNIQRRSCINEISLTHLGYNNYDLACQ